MNMRTKTTLIIIVTFLLGIIVGIVGLNSIHHYRMKKQFHLLRTPDGFPRFIERIIEPTETQRQQMVDVLEKYSPRFRSVMDSHRNQMEAMLDSMLTDLEPILTQAQLDRLQEHREHGKRLFDREMRPPPPDHDRY